MTEAKPTPLPHSVGLLLEPTRMGEGSRLVLKDSLQPGYTVDQMREYGAACAREERQRCAAAVRALDCAHRCGVGDELAAAILAQPALAAIAGDAGGEP